MREKSGARNIFAARAKLATPGQQHFDDGVTCLDSAQRKIISFKYLKILFKTCTFEPKGYLSSRGCALIVRLIPEPAIGAIIMSSSTVIFGACAPQTSVLGYARLRAQMRTWLPVLVCTLIFAAESTPYFGADRTSAPLRRLAEIICGYGVDAHWAVIHHLIRKTGHFMGFGIFSMVCFRGFWITLQGVAFQLLRQLRAHGLAILSTFLMASADEFHQSFLPNRTGQFSDVLLDCCGAAVLCFVLFLVMQVNECRKQARARAGCHLKPSYAGITI